MKEAPKEKITVIVKGEKIVLDPVNMHFNENAIGSYMNEEYGWVDYFGKQLEFAQKELLDADIDADAIYSKKFLESKDLGNSDNYAKAYALSHAEVIEAKKKLSERKEVVGHLKSHLKAWSTNHENAQNRGHSLRTEMKILNREIYPDDNMCSAEDFLKENL